MNEFVIIKIIEDNNEKLIKKIIDENRLIENDKNRKLIHYICIYANSNEIIKYILDKSYDLEEKTDSLNKPIHLICLHQDEEMIKYIIDKKVYLNDKNDLNLTPIDHICERIKKG